MKTAVVGLGNVLVGDDAFGPYVVRLFDARYHAGTAVEVLDLGTPGLDLAPHLAGLDALIVVDTVRAEAAPGTLRLYRKDELLSKPATPRTNPHQPGVEETVLRLELENSAPAEVLLIGVVPAALQTGIGLTEQVSDAAEAAVDAIHEELTRLGHPLSPREPARDPDIWWERRSAVETAH